MQDKIRSEWLKKVQEVEHNVEKTVDASKKRRHCPYVMNKTMKPLFIAGFGNDYEEDGIRIKKTIMLGVLGEDERCTAIQDIRGFTDNELDNCKAYNDFLQKGLIKEIEEDEARYRIEKAVEYLQRIRHGGLVPRTHVFEKQRPVNPYYSPESAQYYQQVQENPIEPIDLGRKKTYSSQYEDFSPFKDSQVAFDSMTDFYSNLR